MLLGFVFELFIAGTSSHAEEQASPNRDAARSSQPAAKSGADPGDGNLPPTAKPSEKLTAKGVEFFESRIRPVLTQRCYSCHSEQSKEIKGGLRLDTRDGLRKGGESGAAIVPGDVAESLLIQALKHESVEMPPGDKLSDQVIADFEAWIRLGAPDPRTGNAPAKKVSVAEARTYWAFRPLVASPAPAVRDAAWPVSDLDRFVLNRLESRNLHPVGDADRVTLVRRAYFDLLGLPPTPEQIDQFLSDSSPQAYERLLDQLLQSPQFGERWGRHWLDVARFGESTGKERNVPFPHAWRYRDYVIDAFNQDKPYDRFIREQIAGDLLQASSVAERNSNLTATGFLAIGTKSLNERNREQYLMDQADEQIDVATRVVMGMTVSCARCHDHKFDPITQADYYAVAGIFRSTQVLAGVQPGNNRTGYAGTYAYLESAQPQQKPTLTPEQEAEVEGWTKELKELRARRQQLAAGKANVTPQGKGKAGKAKAKAAQKSAAALDRLNQRIDALESQLREAQRAQAGSGAPIMAVRDAPRPANCRINIRGEVKELGDEVARGVPVVLAFDRVAKFDTEHSGRLLLASWLVSRENPLTPRVMSNRVWAHLFGKGIVESVDNFGTLGDEPTHPELLDYLALRFQKLNWSVKSLIKEIMLSRTYRMSSEHQEAAYALDPDNRMLWRMNRRRLEAEAIRDSLLAVSGQLNLERPPQSLVPDTDGMEFGRGRRVDGPDLGAFTHRSVYLPAVRGKTPEMLSVFDMADPSLVVGQRDVTTVATQALFMMNSPFVMAQANATVRRLLADQSATEETRVRNLFRQVLGREPTSEQREQAVLFVRDALALAAADSAGPTNPRQAAWSSLCQSLMATAEFRYVY